MIDKIVIVSTLFFDNDNELAFMFFVYINIRIHVYPQKKKQKMDNVFDKMYNSLHEIQKRRRYSINKNL